MDQWEEPRGGAIKRLRNNYTDIRDQLHTLVSHQMQSLGLGLEERNHGERDSQSCVKFSEPWAGSQSGAVRQTASAV